MLPHHDHILYYRGPFIKNDFCILGENCLVLKSGFYHFKQFSCMNSVSCMMGCDYFVCDYCFDNLTNHIFKEDFFSGGLDMYLCNNMPPSNIYYSLINSEGFSNIYRYDQKYWKLIHIIDTISPAYIPAYSKVLNYNLNTFITVGGSNQLDFTGEIKNHEYDQS